MKTVIIGAGKFGRSLFSGLIDCNREAFSGDISVFVRNDREVTTYKGYPIRTVTSLKPFSRSSEEILYILCVQPKSALEVIKLLSGNVCLGDQVLSFVSGLYPEIISNKLGINMADVAIATGDTNVGYNSGIVCYSGLSWAGEYLNQFGTVVNESPDEIQKSITTVGAGKAFYLVFLKVLYFEKASNVPVDIFIGNISKILKYGTPFNKTQILNDYIWQYLSVKKEVFEKLFYDEDIARERARVSFLGTVEALCLIQNKDISIFDAQIQTVVTPGGCTEKGISLIRNLEDALSVETMFEAISLVHSKTLSFKNEVEMQM
jgi:pyrroline-5-carboxylate reductase